MSKNYYVSGEYNIICDSCGKKIKAHEARMRWDGLLVCKADWEERQPQDFVRARQDKITVPISRPRPTDEFVFSCTLLTSSPNADVAVADCAIVGNTYYTDYYNNLTHTYSNWALEFCSYTTRTGIAGIGQAGCMTAGYEIDGY